MITTLETGAVFKLIDEFSRPGAKLFDVLERADRQAKELQIQLDKISLGTAVKMIDAQWKEISAINDRGVAGIVASFNGIARDVEPAWAKVVAGADGAFDSINTSGSAFKREMIATFDAAGSEAAKALASSLDTASAGMFTPVVGAARSAAAEVSAIMGGVSREIEAAGRSGAASTWANSNASLGTRKAAAHGVHGAHANGLHFGRIGGHIGGSHVSAGGDGLVPAVAGFGILDVMAHATEGAMEMRHWKSQFQAANFSPEEIGKAESAAWANAMRNPNVSATDNLKALYEMVKVFPEVGEKGPGIGEAIAMLPSFTDIMTGLESVKAEGIHSKFSEGKQIYDLAKGLEETGVTQRGATVEERLRNTRHMEMELFKTMLSERGVTDGTQFYQMTNNSKGASQNWDERMATVVAPILGSVMRHSKMGNADYMVLKTFQAGRADSKTVEGLVNAGLLNEDIASGMAWQDKKKQWHLEANNAFARGSEKNLWDWSGRQLDVWKGQGVNINDQEAINAKINQIGANASTTTMLRALLEPSTRSQISKNMWARDQIGDNALGILKDNDPVLKIGALEKALSNFFASFGAGLVDPAIAGLTALTSGLNAMSKAMEKHPDLAKFAAENAAVAGAGLLGFGGAKMLGLFGSANTELTKAALMLQEAAVANGAKGGVGGALLNGAEKVAPGLPFVGLGLPLFGAGMFVTEALLNRDQSKSLVDGGRPDVRPWDNNLGLPGLDNVPTSGPGMKAIEEDRTTRARASEADAWRQQQDIMKAASQQFGRLNEKTGFVLTAWDGLNRSGTVLGGKFTDLGGGSGTLDNAFKILEATAMGAARALASVAMSGGMGSGSGFTNASWGGGGSPDLSAAFRGGAGPGIGHFFSAADREKNIRSYAASIGINPDVAMAVARSEGFGRFDGDHGTSFGDLQMHIGGGLGDLFRRVTGKNPADPHNELELDRFALDQAKRGGWGPWHGAAAKHIYGRYGMDYQGQPHRTVAPPTARPHQITVQVPVMLDKKIISRAVTTQQVRMATFPTAVGGIDAHGSFASPSTPLMDVA